jgi:hypothetical protein
VVCYLVNHRFGLGRVAVVVLAVNAFSLPFVWFIFPAITSYDLFLFISETFAMISEALSMRLMFPTTVRRALATSIGMNMASFSFGILFPWLIF